MSDLQERLVKNKSEQNQKLAEFEKVLAEKTDENESIKEELIKCRENVDNLNKLNQSVSFERRYTSGGRSLCFY